MAAPRLLKREPLALYRLGYFRSQTTSSRTPLGVGIFKPFPPKFRVIGNVTHAKPGEFFFGRLGTHAPPLSRAVRAEKVTIRISIVSGHQRDEPAHPGGLRTISVNLSQWRVMRVLRSHERMRLSRSQNPPRPSRTINTWHISKHDRARQSRADAVRQQRRSVHRKS